MGLFIKFSFVNSSEEMQKEANKIFYEKHINNLILSCLTLN